MNGVLLGSKFSWGCNRANLLKITPALKEYALSDGKTGLEKDIREALKKLYSYIYYLIIAESNNIRDPFDSKVVEAHWIGNELLENVKDSVVKKVFKEMESGHDKVILGYVLMPLIKKTGLAHHNFYARHNPKCSVTFTLKDGCLDLDHLRKRRMKASPKDIENLKKYGGKR